jgi:hypothetical protein
MVQDFGSQGLKSPNAPGNAIVAAKAATYKFAPMVAE